MSEPTHNAQKSHHADRAQPEPHGLDVPAGVAAMAFPGLGHLMRGEPKRALYAAIGVLGMFFGGMLIGGIDVVDSKEDKWWFYGQAFVGPIAFGADWFHQNQLKAHPIPGVPDGGGAEASYSSSDLQLAQGGEHARRSVFPREKRVTVDVEVSEGNAGKVVTRRLPVAVPAGDGEGPPNVKSMAKVNEIGTLYALCAGMLNLIVILDALFPTIRPVRRSPAKPQATTAKASPSASPPPSTPPASGDEPMSKEAADA